jgi:hypothetical protein
LHTATDGIAVIGALVDGREVTLDEALQLLPAGGEQ